MHKLIFLLLALIGLLSCDSLPQTPPKASQFEKTAVQVVSDFDINTHIINYESLKGRIRKRQQLFTYDYKYEPHQTGALAQTYLYHTLVDSIFPYWYGTPWDFNGYTETPRKGRIACGYFVSTTLRDLGFRINRYKLAQKASLDILKEFSKPRGIQRFDSFEKMESYLAASSTNEIYILGLDYHVGFVIRKDKKLFFIHSSFLGNSEVEKEILAASDAAKGSNLYYLGSLTGHEGTIQRWLRNSR